LCVPRKVEWINHSNEYRGFLLCQRVSHQAGKSAHFVLVVTQSSREGFDNPWQFSCHQKAENHPKYAQHQVSIKTRFTDDLEV
jgi:hypothetical protein